MRAPLVVLLTLSFVFAGCVSNGSDTGDAGDALIDPSWTNERMDLPENFMPDGGDHDHGAMDQHDFFWNYELSSFDPIMSNAINEAGLHAIIRQGDYLYGALWGSHNAAVDGGFVIWDISDATDPVQVGRATVQGTVGGDRSLGVSSDGNYVVLGSEKLDCYGHVNPTGIIAYLFDVSDKTDPVLLDTLTDTSQSRGSPEEPEAPGLGGTHSVEMHTFDGEHYAVLGTGGDVFHIDLDVTLEGNELPGQMVRVGNIPVGHDIYIRPTPWGDVWGLSATESTFHLQDLTDITDPKTISVWQHEADYDARQNPDLSLYYHTADVAFFEDQTIAVQTSEDFGPNPSPFWVLDITDPEDPINIGYWENPFGVPAYKNGIFSQHNPRISEDGIMTLTHYHAGLIQFDFRHPDFRGDPAIIAYAAYAPQPAPVSADPTYHPVSVYCGTASPDEVRVPEAMMYVDLALGDDGILYIADVINGLITFTPTTDHPVYGDL